MKMSRSTDHATLLRLLKEERTNSGLRQVDLAKHLGAHQSFVSKYEVGERRFDILELKAICTVFDLTLGEFIARLEAELEKRPDAP